MAKAINWHVTTDRTREEIADRLGVSPSTVDDYLASPEAEEVDRVLALREAEVRKSVVEELRQDLRQAGERRNRADSWDQRVVASERMRHLLDTITSLVGATGRR